MPHNHLMSHGTSRANSTEKQCVPLPHASFNLEAALIRLGGDRELLAALIDIFLEDGPPLMGRVKSAYLAPDRSALHHAAHSLRGLASNFDARDVTEPALRLEQLAVTSAGFDPATDLTVEQLERAIVKLTEGLRQFRP